MRSYSDLILLNSKDCYFSSNCSTVYCRKFAYLHLKGLRSMWRQKMCLSWREQALCIFFSRIAQFGYKKGRIVETWNIVCSMLCGGPPHFYDWWIVDYVLSFIPNDRSCIMTTPPTTLWKVYYQFVRLNFQCHNFKTQISGKILIVFLLLYLTL